MEEPEELSMVSWNLEKGGGGWVKQCARCSDLKNEVYSGDPNLNKGLMHFGRVTCIERVKIG
jgi:hypothetical protein